MQLQQSLVTDDTKFALVNVKGEPALSSELGLLLYDEGTVCGEWKISLGLNPYVAIPFQCATYSISLQYSRWS